MSIGAGADKAKIRRLTSEGAALPSLPILQRVAAEAAGLLARIISALGGPCRSKIDIDIAWLTTIATQFRSAAARLIGRRRTRNIGAADIAGRHGKEDNSIHFGKTHDGLSVKRRCARQGEESGQNPVRRPHFSSLSFLPAACRCWTRDQAHSGSRIGPFWRDLQTIWLPATPAQPSDSPNGCFMNPPPHPARRADLHAKGGGFVTSRMSFIWGMEVNASTIPSFFMSHFNAVA